MQYFLKEDVYTAARKRIEWLFDEFENVIVSISGGKDSTVVYHMALEIAKEKNRLPLPVLFLDEEGDYEHTIEYIRTLMYRPEIRPIWFQGPFVLGNSAAHGDGWLHCWEEGGNWLREKEECSIKTNPYGTNRFKKLFDKMLCKDFKGQSACYVGGVRAEESPGRRLGLTGAEVYKGETWGSIVNRKERKFTFYPIYDWSYTDVWHYIAVNHLPYNKIYDLQYSHGVPIMKMRVSSLSHETSVLSLQNVAEFEPETWNKIVDRLEGANSVKQARSAMDCPKELPFMFKDWVEYRDYLLDHFITAPEMKEKFQNKFRQMDVYYENYDSKEFVYKSEICAILGMDFDFTGMGNLMTATVKYNVERKKYNKGLREVREIEKL